MWIALQRRGTDEGGFTLVELLVVVLIIALLAALGISSFMSQRSKAQDAEAKQVMRTASHALQVFHMDHDTYNATVAELEQIEPSLRAARNLVANGTVNTYDIAADSASGANTYALALVARALGADVTGSDRAAGSPYAATLRAAGIEPAFGHAAENVPEDAEVVYSSAIAPDNPERAVAQRELHRADLLAELTRLKPTVAVTGTHGKTTTSSMIVHAMIGCGLDPSYLVGGEVRSTGTNAAWGAGEWLVVEADESDRSLLKLSPRIAVLTNAELDHHTTYASQRDVDETFRTFLASAATAVVWDRPRLRALAEDPVTYDADPLLRPNGSAFEFDGVTVELGLPGVHNAQNAAGALTASRLAGADAAQAARALASFTGAGRRFERLGMTPSGALVVDDYAHHPTEVRATIDAARTLAPARIVAVFQPHLFSRTARQARGFR